MSTQNIFLYSQTYIEFKSQLKKMPFKETTIRTVSSFEYATKSLNSCFDFPFGEVIQADHFETNLFQRAFQ